MRVSVGVLLVTVIVLVGCAAPRASTPAAAAQAGSASVAAEPPPLQKVRGMATNVSYVVMALPVAREAGLFEKYGLDAEVLFGPRGIPALMAGEVQFATGADETVLADLSGADLVMVATMLPYVQHKFMVRPEIQTAADLKDRAVGISRRATFQHMITRTVAKRGGLDPERDVLLVEIPDTASQVAALSSGAIAAVSIAPPSTDIAEANGARALYDFGQEQFEYATQVIVVDRAWAAQNERAVLAYLKALTEAVQLAHTQPDFVADVFARWSKTDEQAGAAAVAMARRVLPLKMYPTRTGVQRVLDTLSDQVPEAATADPGRFYDDRYIRQLDQEGYYTSIGGS